MSTLSLPAIANPRSLQQQLARAERRRKFKGFSLTISAKDEAEAEKAFAALSEGGQVTMPLTKTFWSPRFGMLTDRFGVGWMVSVFVAG